ncbi:MAG: FAD-dependent oxidoreductase, partial [Deltaproteobacteria bacterium]
MSDELFVMETYAEAHPFPPSALRKRLSPGQVTIFGAGIAGLTAAHELVERGFTVIVVEPEAEGEGEFRVGGMARSQRTVGEPKRFDDGAVLPWIGGSGQWRAG